MVKGILVLSLILGILLSVSFANIASAAGRDCPKGRLLVGIACNWPTLPAYVQPLRATNGRSKCLH